MLRILLLAFLVILIGPVIAYVGIEYLDGNLWFLVGAFVVIATMGNWVVFRAVTRRKRR